MSSSRQRTIPSKRLYQPFLTEQVLYLGAVCLGPHVTYQVGFGPADYLAPETTAVAKGKFTVYESRVGADVAAIKAATDAVICKKGQSQYLFEAAHRILNRSVSCQDPDSS